MIQLSATNPRATSLRPSGPGVLARAPLVALVGCLATCARSENGPAAPHTQPPTPGSSATAGRERALPAPPRRSASLAPQFELVVAPTPRASLLPSEISRAAALAPAHAQWWLAAGAVEWLETEASPRALMVHTAPLDGGTPLIVPLADGVPESGYDSPSSGGPLFAQSLTPLGRRPDGMLVLAGASLVWVNAAGLAVLSVPWRQRVARAGAGVAVAIADPANRNLTHRVERWVGGTRVASVDVRSRRGPRAMSLRHADDDGFELSEGYPGGCVPGGGGLPPALFRYRWDTREEVRSVPSTCAAESRGDESFADASRAWLAADGSVLVPGSDSLGPCVVQVRTR